MWFLAEGTQLGPVLCVCCHWMHVLRSVKYSWVKSLTKIISFFKTAAAASKSIQSCPTMCDPMDSSPPGSPVPGIPQARTLEWVTISFSNAWKWKVKVKSLSHVWLFTTPWAAAYQAPPSMGFSRQEYWSGVPSLSLTKMVQFMAGEFESPAKMKWT